MPSKNDSYLGHSEFSSQLKPIHGYPVTGIFVSGTLRIFANQIIILFVKKIILSFVCIVKTSKSANFTCQFRPRRSALRQSVDALGTLAGCTSSLARLALEGSFTVT